MKITKTCVICRKGTLHPAEISLEREVAGHRFTTTVHGMKCDACGEEQLKGPDLGRFEREIARSLVGTAPTGETIRYVRKALGYTGKELGELLGVTIETISRWERELHPIDRQAWALLGLLAVNKEQTEAMLRAAGDPSPLPAVVALKVA
jgi:putative zinc finger/helix-turn-helix YgiT family protein